MGKGKKIVKNIVIVLLIIGACVWLSYKYFTDWSKNDLEKEGYSFVEDNNWYEMDGEKDKELLVNLSLSEEQLSKRYVVPVTVDHIVFIGSSYKTYLDFTIIVAPRSTPITVELHDFSYAAPAGSVALDASDVSDDNKVYLVIEGMVEISGGNGMSGSDGESYNSTAGSHNARSGDNGKDGDDGVEAIILNSAYIQVNPGAQFKIKGGNGGNGGNGGQGEGSDAPGTPRAGRGGHGGKGGNGAPAFIVNGELQIDNQGKLQARGGNGGNGGNAGDGGLATVKYPTDIYDNGGNGGDGGNGGNGEVSFVQNSSSAIKIKGRQISLTSGNGGSGGTGGNGGKTGSNFASKGAQPGNGGSGGNGGNGAIDTIEHESVTIVGGAGGNGGSGGEAGSGDKKTGSGSNGSNGENGRSF